MNAKTWQQLSTWHNAWLAADPVERADFRSRLAEEQPELVSHADELVAASTVLHDFLETPAFVLAAQHLAAEEPTLAAGTVVGPYCVVSLLARGGMGDVYRATDPRLRRDVALKVLACTDAIDGRRVERFLQEARLTAALDHPNIVKIYDVGVFHDRPYLVAELLEGETLRARIGSGPIPPAAAVKIGAELARGLAAAHAAGLIHRDLKPENIFLTRSGVTKILDFGIAKLVQDEAARESPATMTGVLLGTAGYLAPEQIRGDTADGRADLFALGSMLFETLTGVRAFARAHTVDTLHAIMHDPVPALLDDREDVSPALRAIVGRLLEKNPADRFQSASDVVWALEQSAGDSSAVTVPRALRHARPWPRRSLLWPGFVAAIVGALVGVAWWSASASARTGARLIAHPVHLAAAGGDVSGIGTRGFTRWQPHRVCRIPGADGEAVRSRTRVERRNGHCRLGRREAAVLVARRPIDRVLRPRQADEGGPRRRCASRRSPTLPMREAAHGAPPARSCSNRTILTPG